MKFVFGLIASLALILVSAGSALAWTAPDITPLCAPNANSYAFTVTLSGEEPNYDYDWSFDQFESFTTVDGNEGDNSLVTPRGGDVLYVRWSSDHESQASAEANDNLCQQPTPSPSPTPTPPPTPTPTPSATPAPSETPIPCEFQIFPGENPDCPVPSETPNPTPHVTPNVTLPPTDTSEAVDNLANTVSGAIILYFAIGALLIIPAIVLFALMWRRIR